jgi:phospholipase/carboxylesterase
MAMLDNGRARFRHGLAGDALVKAGFETYGHVMEGTGHGIAPDGLSVALSFLRDLPG